MPDLHSGLALRGSSLGSLPSKPSSARMTFADATGMWPGQVTADAPECELCTWAWRESVGAFMLKRASWRCLDHGGRASE